MKFRELLPTVLFNGLSRMRAVRRSARRRRENRAHTERYLSTHPVACLHLGCGANPLQGWLNSDIASHNPVIIELDATQRFPFDDAVLDFIFTEHMIEHLSYAGAQSMLDECFRTLKPGGVVRISTPDLAFLLALFSPTLSSTQKEYIDWSTRTFFTSAAAPRAVFVLNNFVRSWGHQFIYDEETLRELLDRSGFIDPARCALDESRHAELRGLENKMRMPAGFLELETMTFEASKPGAGGAFHAEAG